jgi:hypothetical protein
MLTPPDVIRAKFNSEAARQAFDHINDGLQPRWDLVINGEGVHLRPCVRVYEIDGQQPFRAIEPARHVWFVKSLDEAVLGLEKAILDEGGAKGAIVTAFGIGDIPDRSYTLDITTGAFSPIAQEEIDRRIFRRSHPKP